VTLTPAQCRAARALLNITQEELAAISGVSVPTIKDLEREARKPLPRTLRDLRQALEGQGVQFVEVDGMTGVVNKSPEKS